MVRVNCPASGRDFEFPDFLRGLTAICKNCSQRIPVPASDQTICPAADPIPSDSLVVSAPPIAIVSPKADLANLEKLRTGTEVRKAPSPATATSIIEKIPQDRTRREIGILKQARHRVLSSIIASVCVVLAYWFLGVWPARVAFMCILLPLACIWYGKLIGQYVTKYGSSEKICNTTSEEQPLQ